MKLNNILQMIEQTEVEWKTLEKVANYQQNVGWASAHQKNAKMEMMG